MEDDKQSLDITPPSFKPISGICSEISVSNLSFHWLLGNPCRTAFHVCDLDPTLLLIVLIVICTCPRGQGAARPSPPLFFRF